jgi:adenylate cyclase
LKSADMTSSMVSSQLILSLAFLTMLVCLLIIAYGYVAESRKRRDLVTLLRSYLPHQLVSSLSHYPNKHAMKAANKDLSVMFCDLRGFTQLGQDIPPTQLQQLLNDVFSRLSSIILKHHGTVDKYMGDCIMAFWGAPVDLPNHAELAVAAALDIINEVKNINKEHQQKHLPVVKIGIGVNTGVMCVGDMGSSVRRSYTVIGDAVNVASRLQGLTKSYKTELLVGVSTKMAAPTFDWLVIDEVILAGKSHALAIFTIKKKM